MGKKGAETRSAYIVRLVLTKVEKDLRGDFKESYYTEVLNRKVSVIPFFINAFTFMTNPYTEMKFRELFYSDIGSVVNEEIDYYHNIIGESNYILIQSLCLSIYNYDLNKRKFNI